MIVMRQIILLMSNQARSELPFRVTIILQELVAILTISRSILGSSNNSLTQGIMVLHLTLIGPSIHALYSTKHIQLRSFPNTNRTQLPADQKAKRWGFGKKLAKRKQV